MLARLATHRHGAAQPQTDAAIGKRHKVWSDAQQLLRVGVSAGRQEYVNRTIGCSTKGTRQHGWRASDVIPVQDHIGHAVPIQIPRHDRVGCQYRIAFTQEIRMSDDLLWYGEWA